jgi:uncharacterized damage-inducible protein DinB
MFTLPYRTLIHQKRWATNGLNGVLTANLARLPADEQVLVRRLLDHVQTVDEIFQHNLEARPHGHRAPRSAELPSFDALADKARTIADWYVDYADGLTEAEVDQPIAFAFSNGEPASMTRGEMLLHVVTHTSYHRGFAADLFFQVPARPPTMDLPVYLREKGAQVAPNKKQETA